MQDGRTDNPSARRSASTGALDPFRIGVLILAALVAVGMVRLRFCSEMTLPAKVAAPEPREISLGDVTSSLGESPSIYAGYLEKDAETYGVAPVPEAKDMSRVLRHQVDDARQRLDPKKNPSIESAGLKLSISVRKIEGTPLKMMVLGIENLTEKDLAYRIVTEPKGGAKACRRKVTLIHNAMAIKAGARVERSECLYRRGWTLELQRVETLELPSLSFFYVSKVPPEVVGIDSRVGGGHAPPVGRPCRILLPGTIRNARDAGDLTWRDLTDFFARHRCETYRFPEGYKALSEDGQVTLPAASVR